MAPAFKILGEWGTVTAFTLSFRVRNASCLLRLICILPAVVGLGVCGFGIVPCIVGQSLAVHPGDQSDHAYEQDTDHYIHDHLSELVVSY